MPGLNPRSGYTPLRCCGRLLEQDAPYSQLRFRLGRLFFLNAYLALTLGQDALHRRVVGDSSEQDARHNQLRLRLG